MRVPPLKLGTVHFVGIGGIGMSGIAEVLHTLGYKVQGSDVAAGAQVQRLRAMGIEVAVGHDAANVKGAQVVVVSSAVKADNPEVVAARAHRLPVVRRAEMLAELMRLRPSIAVAGTHGKTTTTSMIAAVLDAAGLDPTVVNGGVINAYGSNARLGHGEWLVAEADESDGSFLRLPATVGVVTNIDPEHMEHYGAFEALRGAFDTFVQNLPFYGFAALCLDHPEVQALMGRITDRRVVTYGFSPQADVRASEPSFDAEGAVFDVAYQNGDGEHVIKELRLAMPGRHNVSNALAAIVVARELDVAEATIREAFAGFGGVKRRFTKTGVVDGITVIDDYGHHPVEIRAVLATARAAYKARVVAVVQPHRYSRLHDLFEEFCTGFNDADTVIVAPVYAAGEAPIPGFDHESLISGLRARGHRDVRALNDPDDLPALIDALARPDDVVVCLGAGSVTAWANRLPEQLRARRQRGAA